MRKVAAYLADYDKHHKKRGNKITHSIGIPLIVMSTFALLSYVPAPVSLASLVWLAGCIFYVTLHFQLGLTMVFSTGALYMIGMVMTSTTAWAFFVVGWILQGIGHYVYEKKSPAFADNLIHLLIGPMYLQNLLLRIVKY